MIPKRQIALLYNYTCYLIRKLRHVKYYTSANQIDMVFFSKYCQARIGNNTKQGDKIKTEKSQQHY